MERENLLTIFEDLIVAFADDLRGSKTRGTAVPQYFPRTDVQRWLIETTTNSFNKEKFHKNL